MNSPESSPIYGRMRIHADRMFTYDFSPWFSVSQTVARHFGIELTDPGDITRSYRDLEKLTYDRALGEKPYNGFVDDVIHYII